MKIYLIRYDNGMWREDNKNILINCVTTQELADEYVAILNEELAHKERDIDTSYRDEPAIYYWQESNLYDFVPMIPRTGSPLST